MTKKISGMLFSGKDGHVLTEGGRDFLKMAVKMENVVIGNLIESAGWFVN